MNQIIRIIGIVSGLIILTIALAMIVLLVGGNFIGYVHHQNECNQLKNFIDMESKKWTSQLFPLVLNKAIDKYNKECL